MNTKLKTNLKYIKVRLIIHVEWMKSWEVSGDNERMCGMEFQAAHSTSSYHVMKYFDILLIYL